MSLEEKYKEYKELLNKQDKIVIKYDEYSIRIKNLKKYFKENCPHENLIHYIYPQYERDYHVYTCSYCKTDIEAIKTCSKNIVKTLYC